MLKIAVIDDHPLVRRGIADTLAEQSDFLVVARGGSATDAVHAMETESPDIILVDAMMPGGGVEAIRQILLRWPTAKIIMISIREDRDMVHGALRAGARGYLSKSVLAAELVESVRQVADGRTYVSVELATRLLVNEASGHPPSTHDDKTNVTSDLSLREQQLLKLIGLGRSNQEIAITLGLAENTVKHQLSPLFRKLGVRNRTEAALLASERV